MTNLFEEFQKIVDSKADEAVGQGIARAHMSFVLMLNPSQSEVLIALEIDEMQIGVASQGELERDLILIQQMKAPTPCHQLYVVLVNDFMLQFQQYHQSN